MAGTKKRREREQERRRLGLPAIPGPCPRGCILTKSGYVQENGSAYDPAARKKDKRRKQSKRRAEKEKSKRWLEGRGRGQRGEARCCATAPSAAAVDAALVAVLEERPAAAAEAAHVGQHGRHSKCRGKGCAACGWRGWQSRAEPEAEQEGSSAVDAALVAVLEERSVAHLPVWVPEGNQSVWGFNQKWYAYQKYRYTIPLSQRIKELKKAHRTGCARTHTQCVTRPLTDSGRSICLGLCSLTCCHESPPPSGLFLATDAAPGSMSEYV